MKELDNKIKMEQTISTTKNIYYPPGGILMWIVIFLELLTFGMALIAMAYYGKQEPELFHNSRLLLNTTFGTINTVFFTHKWLFYGIICSLFKREKC